jgi:hypothetical protein
VPLGAERDRHPRRSPELDPVALPVIDGQREQRKAGLPGARGGDHRIEAARDERDRVGAFGIHGRAARAEGGAGQAPGKERAAR